MAFGGQWGDRESMLHPRDSKGRFRSTWSMPTSVVDKIMKTLDSGSPKTFASEDEARNYVGGIAKSDKYLTNRKPSITNFMKGFTKVNDDLRAGKQTPASKEMDAAMRPLPDDLFLTQVVGPETFGLDPTSLPQIEELTGKLVRDKGYTSMNVGAPVPVQAGQIQLSIATPKGTKAVAPSTGTPTRELILSRDQPLRVTKVDADGKGGFYVYAVATDAGDGEAPVDIRNAVPKQGEEAGGVEAPVAGGGTPGVITTPGAGQGGPGRPPGPGPGDRNDGHVGIVGGGPDAGTPTPVETPAGQTPGEVPETPVVDLPDIPEPGEDPRGTFRGAFEEADIKVPSVGTRRKQYMDAYNGVASGKKTPQEAVRDLDNAIAMNKKTLESDKADGTDSGPLPEDIKRQEALSDLIKEHFNFTGRKDFKGGEGKSTTPAKKTTTPPAKKTTAPPVKKATPPAKKTATPAKKTTSETKVETPEKPIRNEPRGTINKTVYDTLQGRSKGPRREYGGQKDADRRTESFKKAYQALAEGGSADDLDALAKTEMLDESVHLQDAGMVGSGIMNAARDLREGNETTALTRLRRLMLQSGSRDQGEELLDFIDAQKKSRAARLKGVKTPAKKVSAPAAKKAAPKKAAVKKPFDPGKYPNPLKLEGRDLAAQYIIRDAWVKHHNRSNGWVGMADLRDELDKAGFSREEQDDALKRLGRGSPGEPWARIIPIANAKALTQRDRDAALRMGGEDNDAVMFLDIDSDGKPKAGTGSPDADVDKMTIPQLREEAKKRGITVPSSTRRKADIVALVKGEKSTPSTPAKKAPVKKATTPEKPPIEKMTIAQLREEAKAKGVDIPPGARTKADIQAALRGEEAPSVKAARERREAREKLAADKKKARETELQARKDQREAAKRERDAAREQERIRKVQEREAAKQQRERDREKAKAEDKRRRDEEARARKVENVGPYDTLTGPEWTIPMLKDHARMEGVTVPSNLRYRGEIRDYIIQAKIDKRARDLAARQNFNQIWRDARNEGIQLPAGIVIDNDGPAAAAYVEQSKQYLANMGIDKAKYKPQGTFREPAGSKFPSRDGWDSVFPKDHDGNHPVPITNFTRKDGYTIKHGVAIKHKGTVYMIETEKEDKNNPYVMSRIIGELEDIQATQPGAKKIQHQITFALGNDPDDEHFQQVYNDPTFRASASAGYGQMNLWSSERLGMPRERKGTLDHEYGHNVEWYFGGTGNVSGISDTPKWKDSIERDYNNYISGPGSTPTRFVGARGAVGNRMITREPDFARPWPYGVTTYGKSSSVEDFAESMRLFMLLEPIGTLDGKPAWFRDIFPNRARELDKLLPDFKAIQEEAQRRYVPGAPKGHRHG